MHTHKRALEAGDKKHGASVHFVSNELDSGPVIIQAVMNIDTTDDEHTLATRLLKMEHKIYPIAIQWYFENRISVKSDQIYLDNKPLHKPALWKNNEIFID